LGTLLYWLATGKQPFIGRNPHHLLKLIVEGRFVDPLQVKPSIGGQLRAIILRCLELEPEKRYQNATELESALTDFVKQIGIESPTETLAEYLSDPEGVSTRLREQTLEHLIAEGERNKKDLVLAFDHFNRALALDEGNPRVLAALARIGRRSRIRRITRAFAITSGAAVLLGLFLAFPLKPWMEKRFFKHASSATAARSLSPSAAGVLRHKTPASSPNAVGTSAVSPQEKENQESAPIRHTRKQNVASTPRQVRFRPFPANISIGVDGAEPRPYGPSFNEIELPAGVHKFRYVGAHECCVDKEIAVKTPPGPGVTVLDHRLAFRPAGLYVVANSPANVAVDGNNAVGRTRSVIQVAHARELVETHQIMVTAPGFQDYTSVVQLRAGRVETVNVVLKPRVTK
jgi:serine/threonine-protein kinase